MSKKYIKRTDVNELGEFGLIDHLTKKFELQNRSSNIYHACKLSKTAPRTMY